MCEMFADDRPRPAAAAEVRVRLRQACSTPARCSRRCTAAPNWAGCTSTAASCRFPTCRDSDGRARAAAHHRPTSLWIRAVRCARRRTRRRRTRATPSDAARRQRAAARDHRPRHQHRSASRWPPRVLDLSAFERLIGYEPDELVAHRAGRGAARRRAGAGGFKGQHLAVRTVDTARCSAPAGRRHLGGVIAANLAGPRRLTAGARARPSARLRTRCPARRPLPRRRPGRQERHRLRPAQAARRFLGHAGGDDGSDAEGDAAPRERAHAGAARAR